MSRRRGGKHRDSHEGDFVNQIEAANKIDFTPRNPRQRFYARSIAENTLTFGTGPAGTGKTYTAATIAARMLLTEKIKRFIIVRPAVAAGDEEHGFLPGDLKRKLAPWARPVTDIIKNHLGSARFEALLAEGLIEAIPFTYMRGLTFEDAFILLDEAQNTTRTQMKLLLTRIGENARLVIDGDITQSDLKGENGLSMAVDMAERWSIPHEIIEFLPEDVVRSDMCRRWVEAFENEEAA
jgi:phosphate starvation-inducible PhoH-like protein